jgi:hypothetical protein
LSNQGVDCIQMEHEQAARLQPHVVCGGRAKGELVAHEVG